MKATGIVRRIDDLGRVVIPKEIRRTMRIREGDPLEIYTNAGGEVIFKKYSPIGEMGEFAEQYAESLYKTSGLPVVISDRESIIACAGVPKKEFLKRSLSKELEGIIENRTLYTTKEGQSIAVTDSTEGDYYVSCSMPIISEGDVTGCVVAVAPKSEKSGKVVADTEQLLIQTAASFLGKQLEQ